MPKKVVLADDNPDDVAFLAKELTDRGYTVIRCTNGEEALDAVRTGRPDAAVLDVVMPRLDGTEIGVAMQSDEETRDIPVIFLTWLKRHDDNVGTSLENPSVVFSKPIDRKEASEIVDAVDRLVARVRLP